MKKLMMAWVIVLWGVMLIACSSRVADEPDLITGSTPFTGKIAFVSSDGKYAIYVMDADGSGLKNLTANFAFSRSPAWSPNGETIAFASYSPVEGSDQIYVMGADGSNPRKLTSDKSGAYSPAWSPDGKQIIFLSSRDGVQYVRPVDRNHPERGIPVPEVYVMNADGSEQRRLTNNRYYFEKSCSWSPKGDVIAVAIGDPTISRYSIEIYFMGLDGVIQKQLTGSGIHSDPAWSPTGEFMAFASSPLGQSDCSGISIMGADGSNQVCLKIESIDSTVQALAPSWSPDGTYIVFSSDLDGDFDLYRVRVDGSELTQMTNEPGDELSPVWSRGP